MASPTRSPLPLLVASLGVLVAVASACSHDWDALEPERAGATTATTSATSTTSGSGGGGFGGAGATSATSTSEATTTTTSTGTGGSGGAGGSGAGGDGAGGLGTGECPAGLGGPALVRIVVPGGAYCMDATEVTNADYDLWLGEVPNPAQQPAHCSANASFTPPGWPPSATDVNRPVVKVDYCDAEAYCAAQGKHLCGAIGGGPLPSAASQDATASEWLFVCTSGGAVPYPYGGAYDTTACNGVDSPGPNQLLDVGTSPGCEGGVQGVFDLVGNVWEWDASCDAYAGPSDTCRVRGGGYDSAAQAMTCTAAATFPRSGSSFNVGFRCCADAAP